VATGIKMSAFARRKLLLEQEKTTSTDADESKAQSSSASKYNGMASAQNSVRPSTSLSARSRLQRTPVTESTDGGSASNSGFNTDNEVVGESEVPSEKMDLDMQDARRSEYNLVL